MREIIRFAGELAPESQVILIRRHSNHGESHIPSYRSAVGPTPAGWILQRSIDAEQAHAQL
jgi:hypothetical protein